MSNFEDVRSTNPTIPINPTTPSPRYYLGNANAIKIFTEHIQTLERHASLLSEAAQQFRGTSHASSHPSSVRSFSEIQNMTLRAQQSLLDAERCQQLFLESCGDEQDTPAVQTQGVLSPRKRARDADAGSARSELLQVDNVKRRRVDRPPSDDESNLYLDDPEHWRKYGYRKPPERALTMDDIRRIKLRVKLSDRYGPRFDANAWIPEWNGVGKPKSTLVELEEIVARVEAQSQAESEVVRVNVEEGTKVEYEDISAEVEARIQASERRRKEDRGELPKKAVKRTWNDRDSLDNTEDSSDGDSYLQKASKMPRHGETLVQWGRRVAHEAHTSEGR